MKKGLDGGFCGIGRRTRNIPMLAKYFINSTLTLEFEAFNNLRLHARGMTNPT
jgi:hypothetical protein